MTEITEELEKSAAEYSVKILELFAEDEDLSDVTFLAATGFAVGRFFAASDFGSHSDRMDALAQWCRALITMTHRLKMEGMQ